MIFLLVPGRRRETPGILLRDHRTARDSALREKMKRATDAGELHGQITRLAVGPTQPPERGGFPIHSLAVATLGGAGG